MTGQKIMNGARRRSRGLRSRRRRTAGGRPRDGHPHALPPPYQARDSPGRRQTRTRPIRLSPYGRVTDG